MHEKVSTKKEKGEKRQVGETMRTSLAMFNEGMTIEEIAKSRNLGASTIATHLAKYIALGELDINKFVSKEKREKAMKIIEESDEIGSVFQMLGGIMPQTEITIFMAWLRSGKK